MEIESIYSEFVKLYRVQFNFDRRKAQLTLEALAEILSQLTDEEKLIFLDSKVNILCSKSFSGHYKAIIEMLDYFSIFNVFDDLEMGAFCKKYYSNIMDPFIKLKMEQFIIHSLDSKWDGGEYSELPSDGSVWLQ